MIDRGIQPKGFFMDDANTLQEAYNKEHADSIEGRRQAAITVQFLFFNLLKKEETEGF